VLSGASSGPERDLSMYDKPLDSLNPDSSSDDDDDEEVFHAKEEGVDDAETEVENSEDDDEGASLQYEQLGSTEFTTPNLDDDEEEAHSDGEFGEFESCQVSHEDAVGEPSASASMHPEPGSTAATETDAVSHVEGGEDLTQDVLGSYHPRSPARSIPPLDQAKIDLIRSTMGRLQLKPLGNAGVCVCVVVYVCVCVCAAACVWLMVYILLLCNSSSGGCCDPCQASRGR
jgi:hypothetical protein